MRLKEKYIKEVVPAMMAKFSYKSKMAVPIVRKVVINTGFGREVAVKTGEEQKKLKEAVLEDLSLISGQKAVLTQAKKAIAGFKIRKGMAIGAKTTLRGQKMNDFLEKIIHVVLPRSRDFRGIESSSVDQKGNLTFAMKEHIAFPEISPEKTKRMFSLEITVDTSAKSKEEGLQLLKLLGFPVK